MPAPVRADWERFLPPFCDGNSRQLAREYAGRSVLVTGAAGSIGSGLARALADSGLRKLLLLDCDEAGLRELSGRLGKAAAEVVAGDVADSERLRSLFSRHRVDFVFHAAASKHVPVLESQPFSAVRNNALGTYALARTAEHAGVPKFVLVSTDKAVKPRSMMGASKRIAELVVVSMDSPGCRMNAIRLCNVIGSSGSVVPIFLEQIKKGQPITVTDPRARRWFLTVGEAVSAILKAGLAAEHGKILLPKVGDPVCIGDLARFLIQSRENEPRLAQRQGPVAPESPLLPHTDWAGAMTYIGLRPGEKLAEELMLATERQVALDGNLAVLETPAPGSAGLSAVMDELGACIGRRDLSGLLRTVQSAVPEYEPSAHLLDLAAAAAVRA